jgi:SAM-dependent methyltransferase
MEVPRDDPAPRRESLERWVAQQAERGASPERPTSGLARARLRLAAGAARARPAYWLPRFADRLLDRGPGTSVPAIGPEHAHPDRNLYGASAWHVLPRALRYTGVSESDVFVDFGCGKGRVLQQAAKRPFRRVIGVEISPALAAAARRGLAARRSRRRGPDVQVVVSDAADFRVPDDMTIAYLFHPFRDETLDAVLRNVVDSLDRNHRTVHLIYVHPSQPAHVLATGRFRLVEEQRSRLLDATLSRHPSLCRASIFEGR